MPPAAIPHGRTSIPSYSAVSGPGKGTNVDDYYAPEINSIPVGLPQVKILKCNPLPDQTAVSASNAWTDSFANIQCYDSLKVQAILNEINGKNHAGTVRRPVPNIFGMNFQAVSVGQKLIEKSHRRHRRVSGQHRHAELGAARRNPVCRQFDREDGRRAQSARSLSIDADRHFGQAWPEPDQLGPLPGHINFAQ